MSSWHSYASIYNLGHAAVSDLLIGPHFGQEKVDGSQFSFGLFEDGLRFRSKSSDTVDGMFAKAVESVKQRETLLHPGWTYRGEYLAKPKHNTLCYTRTPRDFIILFDIETDLETFLRPSELKAEADRIGLECVPLLFMDHVGGITGLELFKSYLEEVSCLGGQKIEGVVVKPLVPLFGRDKHTLMGKYVSEAFKEVHKGEWRAANPGRNDIIEGLILGLRTPARWNKAVQHLRERGELTDSPKDIGALMKEISSDTHKEEADAIKEALFKWAWPQISRGIAKGAPEHYKSLLLEKQFSPEEV